MYPEDKIYEEAAFIGYYMHWNCEYIMQLPHLERLRWCSEVSKINSKLNDDSSGENKNIFTL